MFWMPRSWTCMLSSNKDRPASSCTNMQVTSGRVLWANHAAREVEPRLSFFLSHPPLALAAMPDPVRRSACCRRGYDVIEFAQHGCAATGLEISKSAASPAFPLSHSFLPDSRALQSLRPQTCNTSMHREQLPRLPLPLSWILLRTSIYAPNILQIHESCGAQALAISPTIPQT